MSTEFVTSTGSVGADFNRSEGRAYFTLEKTVADEAGFISDVADFRTEAVARGRRRWVVKARAKGNTACALTQSGLPIEARIPLSLIDNTTTDEVLMLGENIHRSDVPEWDAVYRYWRGENGNFSLEKRLQKIWDQGFALTNFALESDVKDLAHIWYTFGWNEQGVAQFIRDHRNNPNIWFSGVVDQNSQRLVAACMGERLNFAGVAWCESTEYGTAGGFRERGLCTAAVINLHGQILSDVLYIEQTVPLIVAELNLTSRSDIVARHAGMTVPFVEGINGSDSSPRQVLRRNVSVLDGEPTDLSLAELDGNLEHFKASFGDTFRFWRNFIVGALPRQVINTHYRPQDIIQFARYRVDREAARW